MQLPLRVILGGLGKDEQEVAGDVSMGHSQPHTICATN
jgi:hypothetical protein